MDTFYRTTGPANGNASKLVQRVPSFIYSLFNLRYKTERVYRAPPLNFFRLFFDKGSPFKFLDILQQTEVSKSPKGLPFRVFQHYVSKFSFFVVVSKGSPSFFRYFATNCIFKKPKGSPFTILKTLRFLSLRYSADFRRSRLVSLLFCRWLGKKGYIDTNNK